MNLPLTDVHIEEEEQINLLKEARNIGLYYSQLEVRYAFDIFFMFYLSYVYGGTNCELVIYHCCRPKGNMIVKNLTPSKSETRDNYFTETLR